MLFLLCLSRDFFRYKEYLDISIFTSSLHGVILDRNPRTSFPHEKQEGNGVSRQRSQTTNALINP